MIIKKTIRFPRIPEAACQLLRASSATRRGTGLLPSRLQRLFWCWAGRLVSTGVETAVCYWPGSPKGRTATTPERTLLVRLLGPSQGAAEIVLLPRPSRPLPSHHLHPSKQFINLPAWGVSTSSTISRSSLMQTSLPC